MKDRFLNYSVSFDEKESCYVVTAEYVGGYAVLSRHDTKRAAQQMLRLWKAYDRNRRRK